MLHPCIHELTPLELMFLLPLRTVRRRWYVQGPGGVHGMPAVLGHSTVAPCMSGQAEALHWRVEAGTDKVAVPAGDPDALRPFVEFVLPRPLRLKGAREDRTKEQVRAALLEELEKHTWARARKKQVRAAAEYMARCAPGGFVKVDDAAIDALPDGEDGGVPGWLADLMVEPLVDAGDPVAPAGEGPADATAGAGASAAQQAREAGLDGSMVIVPGAGDEADPAELVAAAAAALSNAIKEIAAAQEAGSAHGGATEEEIGSLGKDLDDALRRAQRRAADPARDRHLSLEGGRVVLPAGDDLASLWDWRTWWASSWALWPWGDLTPYYHDREKAMSLREHFAYVLAREELNYGVLPRNNLSGDPSYQLGPVLLE